MDAGATPWSTSSSADSRSPSSPSATGAPTPSPSIVGPLTDPTLPRHYTRTQTIDYAIRTIGKGARLGHQIKSRLQRIKLVGAGRETVPRENDPPLVQLIIAIANAAEDCLTADAGEKGSDLDRHKARLAGLKAAFDCVNSGYNQVGAMAQAHVRLAQEAKKLETLNRHHEEEMELKRRALLAKPKAGDALAVLDDAVRAMSNDELQSYRVTSTDTTTE